VVDGEYEVLQRHVLNEPIRFANHASLEYDVVVADILLRWNVDLVHIRHLAWHGLGLVETARSLGIAVVHSFHDYYTVCPTVNLLDEQGEFHPRGVPRHAPNPLWDQDPTVLPMSAERLDAWQARMQKSLAGVDAFVTTSIAARKLIGEALPLLAARADDFHVIPHGRDFPTFGAGPEPGPDDAGRPLRVLLAGNLSAHKGAVLVRELKQRDAKGEFEFHVMGSFPEQIAPYVVDHGPYRRSEFGAMVARIAPDIAAVLSVWPETYCHVLTECWACGLPVLGVDIGAVGERIRQHGGGWLLDFPATSDALHDRLAELSRSAYERRQRVQDVRRWQIGEGTTQSTAWMAQRYADLYRDVMARHRRLRDVTTG
jgi:glycosyltransferase involved in cell wall biosynthesis